MSFPQVEQIIVDELRWENYSIYSWDNYGMYTARIRIPKDKKRPRIDIYIKPFHWDEKTQKYHSRSYGDESIVSSVDLIRLFHYQYITLHNPEAIALIRKIAFSFWDFKSKEKLEQRTVDDASWADIFRKAFRNE